MHLKTESDSVRRQRGCDRATIQAGHLCGQLAIARLAPRLSSILAEALAPMGVVGF